MRSKNENGQAMVEFALIVPFLLIIVCGIIQVGWIYYNASMANTASRDGARYAAIHYMDDDYDEEYVKTYIMTLLPLSINCNKDTDILIQENTPNLNDIKVTINGSVDIFMPVIAKLFTDDDTSRTGVQLGINAFSIMRMEYR